MFPSLFPPILPWNYFYLNVLVDNGDPYIYNGIQPVADQSISYDFTSNLSASRRYQQWTRVVNTPSSTTGLQTSLTINTDGSGELDFWNGSSSTTLVTYPTGNFQDATTYNLKTVVTGQSLTVYINGVQQYTNATIVPSGITQGTFGFNLGDGTNSVAIDNLNFSEYPVGVGIITVSPNPVQPNSSTNTSANFTDTNTSDPHTAKWDWGDGTTTSCPTNSAQCTLTKSGGSGSVTGSHTYTTAGSYTATLTVTNNNSSSSTSHQVITVSNSDLFIDAFSDPDNTPLTTHDPRYIPFTGCNGDTIISNHLAAEGGCDYFFNDFSNTQNQAMSYDLITDLSASRVYQQWTRVVNTPSSTTGLQTSLTINTDGSGELDFWDNSNWHTLATYSTGHFQNATTYNLKTVITDQSLTVYIDGVQQYTNSSIVPSNITQGGFGFNSSGTSTIDNLVFTALPANNPPSINSLSGGTINEGGTYSETGSFTDPDSTSWTATVDYGDGSGAQPLTLSGTNFSLNHVYNSSGTFTVTVRVTDNQGATGTGTATVTVNAPPSINSISGGTINEGGTYTSSSSFTDPDSTSWTATVDYGDGGGAQSLTLNSDKTFSLSHLYKDNQTNNAPYTVTVKITDNQGATGTGTATVTVNNVAPTPGPITAPSSPVLVNTAITASANFTDPGVLDTHTASWNWGDNSTPTTCPPNSSSCTLTETNGSGSVTASHTYTATGVYMITLTVTDKDGGQGTSTFPYVSVYDSSTAFAGGKSFDNPSTASPNTTGKVSFGISAKYNNSNVLTGTAKMDFKAASLDFASTSLSSLATSNGKAYLKGSGTLNGNSGYTFLATGIDGSVVGGNDLIRFQIINSSNNSVVYDSQPGAGDTADPTTIDATGNIRVH